MNLLNLLQEEKAAQLKGGLYHQTQIMLSYNTNRIEGSKLSEDQTRYIYETNSIIAQNDNEVLNVDDILETINHFVCFDYMLDIAKEELSENHIKQFHKILKNNTSDAKKDWFNVGDYKLKPNVVGGKETTMPNKVADDINNLLKTYNAIRDKTVNDIIDFHYNFEKIHPFQDGNGRVGRLIIFKECLANNIIPFIIEDEYKLFYYRGLKEYQNIKGYLIDTCLSAQDKYKKMLEYFYNKNQ